MVIAFLRGKDREFSIPAQQKFIIEYAHSKALAIEITELDNSCTNVPLEEREDFLALLKKLKFNDTLLVYDITLLSHKVGELTKIFDCIFKHNINIHLCREKIIISKDTTASFMMSTLSQIRALNMSKDKSLLGRPKGSFSKSKFDPKKSEILKMLEMRLSVSEIAKRLKVSRSSLKDYINSRSLKEIVNLQNMNDMNLHIHEDINNSVQSKKCKLTNS